MIIFGASIKTHKPVVALCLILAGWLWFHPDAFAIGQPQYVQTVAETGSFLIAQKNQTASIHYNKADWPGVIRAAGDLQSDISRVTGQNDLMGVESYRLQVTGWI